MKQYDLQAMDADYATGCREHWPEPLAEELIAGYRQKMKREAKKLADWKPRPPLPDEGIDYRAELESMDEHERKAAAKLIEREVAGKLFELPGDLTKACRWATLDDLDGIESLDPRYGPRFDQVRPRMKQGLGYAEAVVSIALGNARRAVARGERHGTARH